MSRSDSKDPQKPSTPEVPPQDETGSAPAADTAPAGGTTAGAPDELAAAKKSAADNYERYLRAMADLENQRRRTVREKEELRLFAASRVIEDLLPVMDNLALGLTATKQPNADLKTLAGGVELVLQQLKKALTGHGLVEINPAGQPFDPHSHEAISHQPDPKVPAEHVLHVVRAGYSLNGRLVRPASVVVSSGQAGPGASAPSK